MVGIRFGLPPGVRRFLSSRRQLNVAAFYRRREQEVEFQVGVAELLHDSAIKLLQVIGKLRMARIKSISILIITSAPGRVMRGR